MEKKNVLLICTDHWPGALFGCAGHEVVMTPTLDSLASKGVRFDNYYSECPVCIPARRSMMTGLSPKTHEDRVYRDELPMPDVKTLAQVFRDNGYQTYAVGKLHVYPQRDRIGFDDVILQEEGRYEFGAVDDYQIWLGEKGYVGQEFMHCMGNNNYYTRNWHLPEEAHPTTWATKEMMKQIKRKDPTRPAFYYMSYQFPHPPLVPLQAFWDMYSDSEIDAPILGDWESNHKILEILSKEGEMYSQKEMMRAKRAFYAQCTHIDYQIRLLIGTLRECNLLDDTIIIFTSDHGDMLFDHNLVAKRSFYENSSCVPMIISGQPVYEKYGAAGTVNHKLGVHADLMPTILDMCGLEIPETVEGISLMSSEEHEYIYGEVGEGIKATRMICDGEYKLIYYPYGNVLQLFHIKEDPKELHDLSEIDEYQAVKEHMVNQLVGELYGTDLEWLCNGKLVGIGAKEFKAAPDFGLYNQRGYHWPTPIAYSNKGKNA